MSRLVNRFWDLQCQNDVCENAELVWEIRTIAGRLIAGDYVRGSL